MTTTKPFERTMQYVRQNGIVRPRDIEAIGIPREYLLHLYRQGKLNRTGRGFYTQPDAAVTKNHSYAELAKYVPAAVLCLLFVCTHFPRNQDTELHICADHSPHVLSVPFAYPSLPIKCHYQLL